MAVTATAHHFTADGVTAAEFREVTEHLVGRRAGVLLTGATPDDALEVTEKSGTPDMSVDVAAGSAVVKGSEAAAQGYYLMEAQSSTNVAIAAADPTNPRKDLIVVRIKDQEYTSGSPSTNTATIEAVTGTPAGSPSVPATPDNCVLLAVVDVVALDTAITDSEITDQRWNGYANNSNQDNGSACLHGGIAVGLSTARPQSPYTGLEFFETDTDRRVRWNGTAWVGDGVWVDYTPSNTNVTLSDENARYCRIGDTIIVSYAATIATVTGAVLIGLPVQAGVTWVTQIGFATAHAVDANTNLRYSGVIKLESGVAQCSFYRSDDAGISHTAFWTTTVPFTWAAADTIDFTVTYEA